MADKPAELFADLSSNNPRLNVAEYVKAGHRLVAVKATEDTNYGWTDGLVTAHKAHALGIPVLWYHFARPGSGVTQAEAFLRHIAPEVKPGDGLCIDCEVTGVRGKMVTAWLNRVHKAHPNLDLWIYGGAYFLHDNGIKPVHGAKLWLAAYGTSVPFIPPGWDHYDAWQFTDAATVRGMSAKVDLSRLHAAPAPKPVVHHQQSTTGLNHKQRSMIRRAVAWYRRWNRKTNHGGSK